MHENFYLMKKLLLFAPIAEREVHFYLAYCNHLKKQNAAYDIQFISFFQPGNKTLKDAGYKVWDIYDYTENTGSFTVKKEDIETFFQIDNVQARTLHEKVTFNIKDTQLIIDKYWRYLNACRNILAEQLKKYRPDEIQVFQELGGFIAPLSLYYNCKREKINHVFFEPSFFRSHMHFVENSLNNDFLSVSQVDDAQVSQYRQKVKDYFDGITKSQKLVIVSKDIQHYKDMGLMKLFQVSNIQKLYNKLAYKYIHRYRQEYEWIGNHVKRNIRQYFNRMRFGGRYQQQIPDVPFVYFPFHVQLDYQLTIRNPEFLNQLALVRHLCETCPRDFKVVVKEHPVTIGGFDYTEFKKLVTDNSNLIVLHPMINTHDIVKKASAIVTVNSKVGAESLLYNKKVVCLGNGFYWNSGVVTKIDGFQSLQQWLIKLRDGTVDAPDSENILKYFSYVMSQSYPFELYHHEEGNLQRYYDSMDSYLKKL
jgi:hypothetical protein